MAVEIKKDGAASAADQTASTEVIDNTPADVFKLELRSLNRLHYGDVLYTKETVYMFDEEGAKHMLALRDPNGGRSFKISTRKVGATAPLKGEKQEEKPEQPDGPIPTPKSANLPAKFIDLSDNDDPDLAAKLAAVDGAGSDEDGLLDTAVKL